MATLLEKLKSSSKAQTEELVDITIKAIVNTNNPNRVCVKCEEGDFFAFTSVFPGSSVPQLNKPLKAQMLLREKGEFVNVISITYNSEDLGKYNMVATHKLPVVL